MSKLDELNQYRDSLSPELQEVFDKAKQEVWDAYNKGKQGGGMPPTGGMPPMGDPPLTQPQIPGEGGESGQDNGGVPVDLSEFFDKDQQQSNSNNSNNSNNGNSDSQQSQNNQENSRDNNSNPDYSDPDYWEGFNDGVKSVAEGTDRDFNDSNSGSQEGQSGAQQSGSQSGSQGSQSGSQQSGAQGDQQSGSQGSQSGSQQSGSQQSGSQSGSQQSGSQGDQQSGLQGSQQSGAQQSGSQSGSQQSGAQQSGSQQGSQQGNQQGSSAYERGKAAGIREARAQKEALKKNQGGSNGESNSQGKGENGENGDSKNGRAVSNKEGEGLNPGEQEIFDKEKAKKIREENGYDPDPDTQHKDPMQNMQDMEKTIRDAIAQFGKLNRTPGTGTFLGNWDKRFKDRDELEAKTSPDTWREQFEEVLADEVLYNERSNFSKKRLALPGIYRETQFYKTRYTQDPGDEAYSAVFLVDLSGSMSRTQVEQCLSEIFTLLTDAPVPFTWIQIVYFSDGIEQYDRVRTLELEPGVPVDESDLEPLWPTTKDVAGGTDVTKSINQLLNTEWTELVGEDEWEGTDESRINENTMIIVLTDGDCFIEGDDVEEELQDNVFIFMSVNTRSVNEQNYKNQEAVSGDLNVNFIAVDVDKLYY